MQDAELSECRACLICTAPITITHLGIDACRACAAFFKRSKIAGRTYTCRQGNGQCAFRKHEKFTCRSCRYDKCIELGMIYVEQPKRRQRKKAEVYEANNMLPSTSSSSTASSSESILDRIENEYKLSYDRRLVQEKQYAASHKLKKIDHPSEELFLCTISGFYDIFRIIIRESMTILNNVFDEFESLPVAHRATLFKNFLGKFCMIEGVYLSAKYFKGSCNNFMLSLITLVDGDNVDQWVTEDDNVERMEDFRTSLKSFAEDYFDILVPMTRMEEVTEREFHALIALAYCDVDPSHHLPDEIIASTEQTRARVFSEMQEYYRTEMNLADFSQRLGNLMTVSHGAREAGKLMNEEMRMYAAMFDVYSDDQLLREIFIE